jgi:NAD(P)-dependent dehydrogenase (short-subunit alcohol dehydrogenase family)
MVNTTNMLDLKNKKVLLTGGSQDIGSAIAEALIKSGAVDLHRRKAGK